MEVRVKRGPGGRPKVDRGNGRDRKRAEQKTEGSHPYRSEGREERRRCDTTGRYEPTDPRLRFWAKVTLTTFGCWCWVGRTTDEGYGLFDLPAGTVRAHRWLWQQTNGPLAAGMTLDHTCEVTACVRPAHLEPVTAAENTRRRHQRARERAARRQQPR